MHSSSLDRKILSFSIAPAALASSYLIARQLIAQYQASLASWIISSVLVVGTLSLCIVFIVFSFRKDNAASESRATSESRIIEEDEDLPEEDEDTDQNEDTDQDEDTAETDSDHPAEMHVPLSHAGASADTRPAFEFKLPDAKPASESFPAFPPLSASNAERLSANLPDSEDSEAVETHARRMSPAEIDVLRKQARERLASHASQPQSDADDLSSIQIPISKEKRNQQ